MEQASLRGTHHWQELVTSGLTASDVVFRPLLMKDSVVVWVPCVGNNIKHSNPPDLGFLKQAVLKSVIL